MSRIIEDTLERILEEIKENMTMIGFELIIELLNWSLRILFQTEIWFDGHDDGGKVSTKQDSLKMHPALAEIYDAGCNVK